MGNQRKEKARPTVFIIHILSFRNIYLTFSDQAKEGIKLLALAVCVLTVIIASLAIALKAGG
jgi:hypothetical protein